MKTDELLKRATARPWYANEFHELWNCTHGGPQQDGDEHFASFTGQSDAELAARAVNTFEQTMEALEHLLASFSPQRAADHGGFDQLRDWRAEHRRKGIALARAALAAMEGEDG